MQPAQPPDEPPRRWHSRRYIPHLEDPQAIQHVTFHLADSLPKSALVNLERELTSLTPFNRNIERRRRLENPIDSGHGACWFKNADCVRIVQDSQFHFDANRYKLLG